MKKAKKKLPKSLHAQPQPQRAKVNYGRRVRDVCGLTLPVADLPKGLKPKRYPALCHGEAANDRNPEGKIVGVCCNRCYQWPMKAEGFFSFART